LGYRAEKQRVLAAWVDPVCAACDLWNAASWLPAGTKKQRGEMVGLVDMQGVLRPVCGPCSHGLPEGLLLPLADVSGMLGTEVRWWE
jgi:hypothetical protein